MSTTDFNILVVDDHEDTLAVLRRLLQSKGMSCQTARSCSEAIAAANAARIDLIVSDLGLPDGNGCDLFRKLRAIHAADGIALTGWDSPEMNASIAEAGFCTRFVKPVKFPDLILAITQLMSERNRRTGIVDTHSAEDRPGKS